MDLKLTADEESFRDELRAWLSDNAPEPWPLEKRTDEDGYTQFFRDWQRKLFDGRWAGLHWPKEYGGRGVSPIQQSIYVSEVAHANAPDNLAIIGEGLVGPTLIAWGTEEQKKRFLPNIISGEEIWCQGYSEPNSGSDLASLGTRAVRDGDDFVVNGQKIWTSFAHIADWCLLLVRTDPDVPKHKGITCLLVDMKSQGVSTKPLRQMSGGSGFNEIFFTDVRVPVENQLGPLNQGWMVGITLLMNERANLGPSIYVRLKEGLDLLIQLCKKEERNGRPLVEDPLVRQKIGEAVTELEIVRVSMDRALSKSNAGETPGPEGSILKLGWSQASQRVSQITMEVLGDVAQLQSFESGRCVYSYLRSRGNTIEGGTSEIQRVILAERVLGLGKDKK